MRQHGNAEVTFLLVGNKSDLELSRQVSTEEGEQFAQKYGMAFLETSAKTAQNVSLAFEQTSCMVLENID